jgi:GTP cyclohydrolase I
MKEEYKMENTKEQMLISAGELILQAFGKDLQDPSLKETPKRFAKMMLEQLEGEFYSDFDLVSKFGKCFETTGHGIVTCTNIPVFSHCEHHLALMYNMNVSIGYYPRTKVIGLSKMARIADMVAKRFQIQERMGFSIHRIMSAILSTDNVIVMIEGEHSCMTARGIKKPGAVTRTLHTSGVFENLDEQQSFINLVRSSK